MLAAFRSGSPSFFLTVRVALAELLTEVLGHDARAGAVTGMFGVVTGLVVVHLGRRVIWSKRRKGRVRKLQTRGSGAEHVHVPRLPAEGRKPSSAQSTAVITNA